MIHTYAVYKRPTSEQKIYRPRVNDWKKYFKQMAMKKKSGVAILISDKMGFRAKAITMDKEGHYIICNGAVQQEDITLVNIYAPIYAPIFTT